MKFSVATISMAGALALTGAAIIALPQSTFAERSESVTAQPQPIADSADSIAADFSKKLADKKVQGDIKKQVELSKQYMEKLTAYAAAQPTATDLDRVQYHLISIAGAGGHFAEAKAAAAKLKSDFAGKTSLDTKTVNQALIAVLRTSDDAVALKDAVLETLTGSAQEKIEALMTLAVEALARGNVAVAQEIYGQVSTLDPRYSKYAKDLSEAAAKTGTAFEHFDVKDIDGKSLKSKDYEGKVLLIDFWATWCGPCKAELPNVKATYKEYKTNGFEVVGIALEKAGAEQTLRNFIKQQEMTWPQYCDYKHWASDLAKKYDVHGIPYALLLDADGNIVTTAARGEALGLAVEYLTRHKDKFSDKNNDKAKKGKPGKNTPKKGK